MYDLIANSIYYEPGEIFGTQMGSPSALFKEAINKNTPNWASIMKANEKKLMNQIAEIAGQ